MEMDSWTIGVFPRFLFAMNPVHGVSREAVLAPPFTGGLASRDWHSQPSSEGLPERGFSPLNPTERQGLKPEREAL